MGSSNNPTVYPFCFDHVFGADKNQIDIYEEV